MANRRGGWGVIVNRDRSFEIQSGLPPALLFAASVEGWPRLYVLAQEVVWAMERLDFQQIAGVSSVTLRRVLDVTALEVYREEIDESASAFEAKRRMLILTRRGGQGKPQFVTPFIAGQGTTCGEWTQVVGFNKDGTPIKGFLKASVAVGFCPVECPFCYLQSYATEAMEIALNVGDLATELVNEWRGLAHPINFGETGGLVEVDEWFADEHGKGSLVQAAIDACARAGVTPFFLTKIRYPAYLQFNGRVQTGISLMPESIRVEMAPHGSPSDELLSSLRWTINAGAVGPVVRLLMLYERREEYKSLLRRCKDLLGATGWRLTLDIIRFTPRTAATIASRHPDAAASFARELDVDGSLSLQDLARSAAGAKKIRPPEHRQGEAFRWVRQQLDSLGCRDIMVTPCKGDPEELLPLVREGVIKAMPCACYEARTSR
jgi:hypothetical protein